MKNRNIVMIIAALCIVIMGACFSPWDGSDDQGSIVINVGNGGAREGEAIAGVTKYTITLTNSGETSISQITTGGTAIFPALQPGPWNILVCERDSKLKGYGEKDVEVKARAVTDVTINMKPAGNVTEVVSTWAHLGTAFQQSDEQVIVITNHLNANSTIETKNKRVTLLAEKDVIITKTQSIRNSLFRVTSDSTLILGTLDGGSIIIDGGGYREGLNSSLICVGPTGVVGDGGGDNNTLEMNGRVTLTNNYATIDDRGGAVVVDGGTFTMNGGEISGNKATFGGGVLILSGTFTQNSGKIYGSNGGINSNNATHSAGGHAVAVGSITVNTSTGKYTGIPSITKVRKTTSEGSLSTNSDSGWGN
jgi:hypothetical protein